MIILGIILTILGFIVFQWSASAQSKTVIEQQNIFNRPIAVITIKLVWIGLVAGGFYSMWEVHPKNIITIICIYAILWTLSYFMGSEKSKAKKLFMCYRHSKLFRPNASNDEIFRETANAYFRELEWNEDKIKITVVAIFEKGIGSKEAEDIKYVAGSILAFERSHGNFIIHCFRMPMKYFSKTQKALDEAYSTVIVNARKVIARPKLSRNTSNWVKSIGLNLDEMTNEQLTFFSEIDDIKKSARIIKSLYFLSFVNILKSVYSLMMLEHVVAYICIVFSLMIWWLANKIQIKRIGKKLHEAGIMKYAQQSAENNK